MTEDRSFSGNETQNDYMGEIENLCSLSKQAEGSEPLMALSYAEQALELSLKHECTAGTALSLLMKGVACEKLSRYDDGIAAISEALDLYRSLGDKTGEARALNSLGICYFYFSRFQDALEYFQACLEIAREMEFTQFQVRTLNNIGEIYREFGKNKEALENYILCLDLAEKTGDKLIKATLLMNIGHLKYNSGDLDEALSSYRKSINIFRDLNEKLYEAEALNKLGEIYSDRKNFKTALSYMQRSLSICRELGNKYQEIDVLRSLGKLNTTRKEYSEALLLLQSALELTKEIQADKQAADLHMDLAAVYEQAGDYKSSVLHYKEYNVIIRNVTNVDFEKKLQAASIRFKLDQAKAEAEIYRLKNIELKRQAEIIESNASELEKSYRNIQIISEIGREITSSLNLERILDTLYKNVNSLMDATCFGVGWYHKRKGLIEYKLFIDNNVRQPVSYSPVTSEESLAAWCIRKRCELMSNDFQSEYQNYVNKIDPETLKKSTSSVIYCPLIVENEVVGVISVQSYKKNAYTEYDLTAIKALASYVAIALNNSAKSEELRNKAVILAKQIAMKKHAQSNLVKANQKLETLLSIDVVTGISNRRSFERFARQVWKHSEAQLQTLSVLLVDIDFFKQYNDTYGHIEGDKCLRKIGMCLQDSIREPTDFTGRYGGEEFVIILPGTCSNDACIMAERLRERVEKLKIPHRESSVCRYVTVSIGIASLVPNKGTNLKQLLEYADKALYVAKNSGRNCVRSLDMQQKITG